MEHKSRDTIVGLFALISLFCFGWMVFRFGDLPGFVSKMDANQISINFTEIPGIQENSAVYFRGYSIGKVIKIDAPAPREGRLGPNTKEFYAVVTITIAKEYQVPENIIPKIYQRGLGSSFIELALTGQPSDNCLADGAKLFGEISTGSQFISENTQNKLDSLIVSLNQLSSSIQSQLKSVSPSNVDDEGTDVNANLTTAIMRFDSTLKNINDILGDGENKQNLKTILNELAAASTETRGLIEKSQTVLDQSGQTVQNIDSYMKNLSESFIPVSAKTQEVADELISTLKAVNSMMTRATDGNGTINRLLEDPALYESLTDTAARLSLAATEMQKLLELWQANGVKMKL